jgi:glycosyltransferase involved in cell wall biosynthesis
MKFLKNKNILIISPEPWGKSMLSKHHYAVALVENQNNVFFLQTANADENIAATYKKKDVHLLNDHYTVRGARYIPSALRKMIYRNKVKQICKDAGVQFDLIWSFDNSRFFDLDAFGSAFTIHHMMDYHTDYQTRTASESANLCLGVTTGIVEKLKQYNPRSYFIHHGYNPQLSEHFPLPEYNGKKALYTGNLLMQFVNWPWMINLVKNNPEVHFFFAGSYGLGNLNPHINNLQLEQVKIVASYSNVTLLGECRPEEIQSYTRQVDILFFAYKANEFPNIVANSHKIMAYLASGRPVVSHKIKEYEGKDLIYMCEDEGEFLNTFRNIIDHPEIFATEDIIRKRQLWALDNTYQRQIERIDSLIDEIISA